jgi:osmotically-inducible protein OsmY
VFPLIITACVRAVVTGSQIAKEITGLKRSSEQAGADLRLEKILRNTIEQGRKNFLNINNLSEFGYYDIKVMEGRVLLTGIVFDRQTKSYIVGKITDNIKVRELLDELEIEKKRELTWMKIKDYFLEKRVNTRIFLGSKIKSLNYEVSSINKKIYVIGIAENREEHELLTKIIGTVDGVREVISYVITVDSPKRPRNYIL